MTHNDLETATPSASDDDHSLYPPSPDNVPDNLVHPSSTYRQRARRLMLGLAFFLGTYILLVAGALGGVVAAGFFAAQWWGDPVLRWALIPLVPAGLLSGWTALFLLRALIHGESSSSESRDVRRVEEEDQPDLYGFVRRLCDEIRAPMPQAIHVSPAVNASVFLKRSQWVRGLVGQAPPNLVVGLGLLNEVNLTEFKAVLAHELAHFSQSTMKLGVYVRAANAIKRRLVLERGSWERALSEEIARERRWAPLAHIAHAMIEGARGLLEISWRGLAERHAEATRQMEFHADLVSTSVVGSDALVQSLSRLDFADACMMQALSDVRHALDDQSLLTDDLFFHQSASQEYLRAVREDDTLGRRREGSSSVVVFEREDRLDNDKATHPSNYERERNAKRRYVRSRYDTRSAWVLIHDAEALRREITATVLDADVERTGAERVQRFIDRERSARLLDEAYRPAYRERFIEPGDLVWAARQTEEADEQREARELLEMIDDLYDAELKSYASNLTEVTEDAARLRRAAQGLGEDTFVWRGRRWRRRDVLSLMEQLDYEVVHIRRWFRAFDRRVLWLHLQVAEALSDEDAKLALLDRYHFHVLHQRIMGDLEQAYKVTRTGHGALSTQHVRAMGNAHGLVEETLSVAEQMPLPPLPNLIFVSSLRQYLMREEELVAWPEDGAPDDETIEAFSRQIERARVRAVRIGKKSLGSLIDAQKRLVQRLRERVGVIDGVIRDAARQNPRGEEE